MELVPELGVARKAGAKAEPGAFGGVLKDAGPGAELGHEALARAVAPPWGLGGAGPEASDSEAVEPGRELRAELDPGLRLGAACAAGGEAAPGALSNALGCAEFDAGLGGEATAESAAPPEQLGGASSRTEDGAPGGAGASFEEGLGTGLNAELGTVAVCRAGGEGELTGLGHAVGGAMLDEGLPGEVPVGAGTELVELRLAPAGVHANAEGALQPRRVKRR